MRGRVMTALLDLCLRWIVDPMRFVAFVGLVTLVLMLYLARVRG